ncbi:MAG: TIGR00269 family protein [Candidatus Bathyarchaeota archaeon]|nr:TIGR00269 family protein [Candidatus Bathyarchaeota archaeon]
MSVTCTKCKSNPSVYYRPYSGERLCNECFNETLLKRVKKTINKYKMFEYNSRIAIGVSGGKDSLTLLRLLHEIESKRPDAELVAVCIDEGVTGYRDEALRLAEKNCRILDVEMHVTSFKELFNETMDEIAARDRELGTCSFCGVLRRRALNEAARQVDADRLATGHNLDDMAQSVLMNILRGDINRVEAFNPGGRALEGYVRRVKPLCEVPEKETTMYAYLNGLEFQNIPCPYAHEAMRSDVRRFLNQMEVKRPGTKSIVYQTGLKIRSNRRDGVLGKCRICGNPTPGEICRVCELTGAGTE